MREIIVLDKDDIRTLCEDGVVSLKMNNGVTLQITSEAGYNKLFKKGEIEYEKA